MVTNNRLNVAFTGLNSDISPSDVESIESEFGDDLLSTSIQLIKILKEIELEMQTMHSKLNDMNEIGEQIGTQLNNSPQLSASINNKMDILESNWNSLLEQMEYLSKVCTEQQQFEIQQQQQQIHDMQQDDTGLSYALNKPKIVLNETVLKQNEHLEVFVSKLNRVFETIKVLMGAEDQLNLDEQKNAIKVKIYKNIFITLL